MNAVAFPGLGLEFNISSTAFKFFGVQITWYAILIVSAMLLGFVICKKKSGLYGINFSNITELSIYLIPISIISARLYYVLFNSSSFVHNLFLVFNLRNGGLGIYGGIIGGAVTTIVFCKKKKINILDMLDYIAPTLAIGQAIGRWGNFINIEAYGTTTENVLRMGIYENGTYKEVHPTFLYESIATFLIFLILIILQKKRKFSGVITYVYLITYSFARIFIEHLRIDSLMLGNYKISQVLSVIIFVVFCSILAYNVKRNDKRQQSI